MRQVENRCLESGQARNDNHRPFRYSYLILILILAATAVATYYLRDSALAATYMNKYLDHQITSGLVGHWTFDGNKINLASTTAEILDSSGNNLHGDWQYYDPSTSTLAMGKLGQAVNIAGNFPNIVTAPRIRIATSTTLNNLPALTFSAWVKYNSSGGGVILDKTVNRDYGWTFTADNVGYGTFRIDCLSGDVYTSYFGNTSIADNQWHHVLVTWDGALNTNGIYAYIDGVEVSTPIQTAVPVDPTIRRHL